MQVYVQLIYNIAQLFPTLEQNICLGFQHLSTEDQFVIQTMKNNCLSFLDNIFAQYNQNSKYYNLDVNRVQIMYQILFHYCSPVQYQE